MGNSTNMKSYIAGLGVALALAMLPGAAMSQSTEMPASGGASASAGSQQVDDATLQRAAKAYVAVRHIATDTKERIARTSDDAEKQQISTEAEKQKLDVVKHSGMAPAQYNRIILLVQSDPNLQQKFLNYVNASGGV